jgi:hypothetical protein
MLVVVISIIIILICVFYPRSGLFDTFVGENLFTDDVDTALRNNDIRICKPIANALGGDVGGVPLVRNMRLISSLSDPENTCYMKANDTVLNGQVCLSAGNTPNPSLNMPDMMDVVDNISAESVNDPYISQFGSSQVCAITFKKDASPERVKAYTEYINNQDPEIKELQAGLMSAQRDAKGAKVQLQSVTNELNDANAKLNDAVAQSSSAANQVSVLTSKNSALQQQLVDRTIEYNNMKLTTSQQTTVFNPQRSAIRPIDSLSKCMDVEGISKADFARVHVWDCWNGNNQKWSMDDKMRMVSDNSGKCLDLNYGNTNNGTTLIQYACHDGPNMKWIYDNKKRLRSLKDTSKCITVDDSKYANGSKLVIRDCTDDNNQKWSL